jgi:hypothetical protein
MFNPNLAKAVEDFSSLLLPVSEKDLERHWEWKSHKGEGVRFAFFVTIQQLRQLAVALAAKRKPPTQAQHILGQYHRQYMDLQAAVLGLSAEDANRVPAEGEWSVRQAYGHMLSAPPQNDPRDKLQTVRLGMQLSPLLPLGFLLLMTIVTVRSLKSWLSWWGTPIAVTGGLTAFLGLVGASVFGTVFQQMLTSRMPSFLPALLLDSAHALATAMLQALFLPILWQGLGIALIGLGMVVAGYFFKVETAVT